MYHIPSEGMHLSYHSAATGVASGPGGTCQVRRKTLGEEASERGREGGRRGSSDKDLGGLGSSKSWEREVYTLSIDSVRAVGFRLLERTSHLRP